MKIFLPTITLLYSIILLSCNNEKTSKVSIKGDINNAVASSILLEEWGINEISLIGETPMVNGKFEFNETLNPQSIYLIKIGTDKIPLLIENKDIIITATAPNYNDLKVTGSLGTNAILNFLNQLDSFNIIVGQRKEIYDSLNIKHAPENITIAAIAEYDQVNRLRLKHIKSFADTTSYLQLALLAVRNLNPTNEAEYLETFANNVVNRFPQNPIADTFSKIILKNISSLKGNGIKIGSSAPNFTLSNPEGTNVSLSQFKGKYILLDFWASWCPPCRVENPNLTRLYSKYKNKNFDIISVSIDDDYKKWVKAIEEDNLQWINVYDPKGWQSELTYSYNFDKIPTNFLIDPNGIIIGKNLNIDDLDIKLTEILIK